MSILQKLRNKLLRIGTNLAIKKSTNKVLKDILVLSAKNTDFYGIYRIQMQDGLQTKHYTYLWTLWGQIGWWLNKHESLLLPILVNTMITLALKYFGII